MEGAIDLGTWTFRAAEACANLPDILPKVPTLAAIKRLQDAVGAAPQIPMEPEHDFAPGMYVRTLAIPAGCVVVGKMHRHAHPTFLVKGTATILTNNGMEKISAPYKWISQPGAKRPVFAHTDCEFVTVHLNPDDTTDLDALEAQIIVPESEIDYLTHDTARIAEFAEDLQGVYA